MFAAIVIGQLAALGTSVCWSFTSIFFTVSGRIVGSPTVNRTRLLFAIGFTVLIHRLMLGTWFPVDATPERWFWLGLSGLIGYIFGDGCLFQALVMIGPRLSTLLMSLNPVISTILAWVFLGEVLAPRELLGIGLVVGGVMIVVADRTNRAAASVAVTSRKHYVIGVLFGLGGALGQAGGLLFSRIGLEGDFSALSGNMLRLIVAAAAIWIITAFQRQAWSTVGTLRENPKALRHILGGAFAGPFLGVWLSLIAVQNAPLGVASTLMGLAPIILIPVSRVLYQEQITGRAIVGTVVAFAGTALLFL